MKSPDGRIQTRHLAKYYLRLEYYKIKIIRTIYVIIVPQNTFRFHNYVSTVLRGLNLGKVKISPQFPFQ